MDSKIRIAPEGSAPVAKVTTADLAAGKAVLHVVDHVIMPIGVS